MRVKSDLLDHWYHGKSPDEAWKGRASCADENPALWFPAPDDRRRYDREVRALTLTAKAICMQCPVSTQCLQYALDLDIAHGIWGGADETERMRLRRPR